MRFLLGVLVGAVLVVGAAYIRDASIDPARSPDAKVMVNWEVVSASMRGVNDWLHDQWTWIDHQLRHSASP